MKRELIVSNCGGCFGTPSPSNDDEEINSMLNSSSSSVDVEDEEEGDDDFVTNESAEVNAMFWIHTHNSQKAKPDGNGRK